MQSVQERLLKLTADEILAINPGNPEALFRPDLDGITSDFRALSKKWFPDLNKDPKASDVQRRLIDLRNSAKDKLDRNEWQQVGYFTCSLSNGKKFRVRSDKSQAFELGTMHISPTTLTYVVWHEHADLFMNAVSVFGAFTFPDDKVKKVYAPCLPTDFRTYETPDTLILTLRKKPEDVLLRDLLPHMAKKDLARHVAWVMSRLHEMARYLDCSGIVHNAVTLDNVFASPSDHTIGLFGGWWYATPLNKLLKAVPAGTEEFLSDETLQTGMPDQKVDLEMIRAVGRELLGDRGGTRLPILKCAPEPMINYLRLPSSGDAQKDLEHWYQAVLPKSYGARRFIELKVRYSDVYPTKGANP
ncbi:MAG: hypothetical protein PHY92_04515 [Alphaproteobacteria bacterium]|nr:hypothetical protein [Alphaproteobacteria bacterium]